MEKLNKGHAILAGIILALFVGFLIWGMTAKETYTIKVKRYDYTLLTVVTDVSKNGTITTVDFNGNEWQFVENKSDWAVNDYCLMAMSDKGTASIEDDEIVETRYNGYLQGSFGCDSNGNPVIVADDSAETAYQTTTETKYVEVQSKTENIYIDASEQQLEEAFTDGYNQGNCDGYADGHWQGYRDCMSDYGLEPQM